jgi:magnesium chelatase subunit I
MTGPVQSLTELLERASARRFLEAPPPEDMGLAELLPYPFLALVGQTEMRLALLLALVNSAVGGVLLLGPRGTGKTTAVRSLGDLLPEVPRSRCPYGCLPEDITAGGIDEVCPDCARRFAEGEPLTYTDHVRLVELPLNSRLEDVVGGLDERAALHNRLRLNRGLLSRADQNILYVDEVNLLAEDIVNAILDAAAQGSYTVHRGPVSATYRARFILIGSMNPEEGRLRPQILDRFGLRVIVRGLTESQDRLEAYRRSAAYRRNPRHMSLEYAQSTQLLREEIEAARAKLASVRLSAEAERYGLGLVQALGIDSLRAEISLFEAARTYSAADGRDEVSVHDIVKIAPMALRLRRSQFMRDYIAAQGEEEAELASLLSAQTLPAKPRRAASRKASRRGAR